MHDVLIALLTGNRSVDQRMWRSFWDRLHDGALQPGETVALLTSLSTRMPDQSTLSALLRSLDERRPPVDVRLDDTVNIVGTGGGPRTFNISTASAFVAAAMGVRVVKTGSRAYSSTCGSFDLLERLGIGLTVSYGQTEATLERFGIAFPGHFVYPREVMALAKSILPLDLRTLGGFINKVGPFLAAMPVSAQLVGVSDPSLLPGLRHIAAAVADRKIWLCANDLGIDELVSSVDNVIYTNDGSGEIQLRADAPGRAPGGITELRPTGDDTTVVEHFLDVLSGNGTSLATRTVCWNAAALAVAGGRIEEWPEAIAAAEDALRGGGALDLVNRMRAQPAHRAADPRGVR
ncbi:anthranilate phosphoribosyltransferase [Streptomyces jumonjinensis]|uniref:Anthranilate phosphoribosyltransferase n=1 Tax=Streptomyces jumonjinensis TaxID=1945 RepID=A0A646KHG1_STRJU|nr:anthranilate phosphoribosyltransferase [Streptomyces jumonjinensis]MQT01722.1 anthranilate phosphoribosyltransferase [Streptomyces jumonjinensis]